MTAHLASNPNFAHRLRERLDERGYNREANDMNSEQLCEWGALYALFACIFGFTAFVHPGPPGIGWVSVVVAILFALVGIGMTVAARKMKS